MPLETLRAGPLTALYDAASGFIRRICLGEVEVLRGIYAAVRVCDWGTILPEVRETRREVRDDGFVIEFESRHRRAEIDFMWRGSVRGEADGTLRYDFDGEARTTFLRNRIGFCVLHPIRECAGARARQTRVGGDVIESRFPDVIEPQIFGQASFRDLRGVAHEVAPGLWAEAAFEGEVFEMEDQRNWTDASFKTYCTPLALPFPVEIMAGERIRQSVTMRLVGDCQRVEIVEPATPAPAAHLPKIGLGVASHGDSLTGREIEVLRALKLDHLRHDVRLGVAGWESALAQAAAEAHALGAGLELAVHLPARGLPSLDALRRELARSAAPVVRLLALQDGEAATSVRTFDFIRAALALLGAPIGAGSDFNFCELNREQALARFPLAQADFLFWAINPQVHAFDDFSIMETADAQTETLRTARAFAAGRPLVISPITLRPRFTAVAIGPDIAPFRGELPPQVDPRQCTEFAADWTRATLRALASAESVTLYETTGWRGVIERESAPPLSEKFPSHPGQIFPVYHALMESSSHRSQPAPHSL